MTLTDFLLARIAEDEAVAEEVVGGSIGGTRSDLSPDWINGFTYVGAYPARVLAECAAKRRIVERHSACEDVSFGDAATCPDVRDLAAIYADHQDYRDEWRP